MVWFWTSLVCRTYQCNRSVWRKAERPSIKTRMTTVKKAQTVNTANKTILLMYWSSSAPKPIRNTLFQSTSDNWEWANDRAHNLKYEAVCETVDNTYSMVWMIWWIINSLKLSSSWPWSSTTVSLLVPAPGSSWACNSMSWDALPLL